MLPLSAEELSTFTFIVVKKRYLPARGFRFSINPKMDTVFLMEQDMPVWLLYLFFRRPFQEGFAITVRPDLRDPLPVEVLGYDLPIHCSYLAVDPAAGEPPVVSNGEPCRLRQGEYGKLKRFCKSVNRFTEEHTLRELPFLANALHMYYRACSRLCEVSGLARPCNTEEDLLDAFLALMVCLESLYLHNESELRQTLANRVSLLLGPTEPARFTLHKLVLGYYKQRSNYVHGNEKLPQLGKIWADSGCSELAGEPAQILDICGRSILAWMGLVDGYPELERELGLRHWRKNRFPADGVRGALDDSLFSHEKRRALRRRGRTFTRYLARSDSAVASS